MDSYAVCKNDSIFVTFAVLRSMLKQRGDSKQFFFAPDYKEVFNALPLSIMFSVQF